MIVNNLAHIRASNIFYNIPNFFGASNVFIKIEGLNIAGSIKLKPAISLVENLENSNGCNPKEHTIIESSSGNLGLALSIVCKQKGYQFICVVDPNISYEAEKKMLLYGARIIKVTEKDKNGGFLNTRIETIKKITSENPKVLWTNQYASYSNVESHYQSTAREINSAVKDIDYLFIGAGTTGTLSGCAKYFAKYSPNVKIIAVDAYGSVTFGHKPFTRIIPGIGTSKKPEIFSDYNIYNVSIIKETSTILMCHYLLKKYGLFLGGSSGSVLEAIRKYIINNKIRKRTTVVAISPDLGDKYINTIYNYEWIKEKFNVKLAKVVEDEKKLFSHYS